MRHSFSHAGIAAGLLAALLVACSTAELHVPTQTSDGFADSGTDVVTDVDSGAAPRAASDAGHTDAGAAVVDAGHDAGHDAGFDPVDGEPTRQSCVNTYGTALTSTYGRLDGRLVAIVDTSEHNCNGDSTHVHLQVEMGGSIYDVAVNMDGLSATVPHAIVGGAWSEGWHTNQYLDYPTSLGVHSEIFDTSDQTALIAALETVNHISVYATGYGPGGSHDVHRHSGGDGAIVTDPLSATNARFFLYRFATDTF